MHTRTPTYLCIYTHTCTLEYACTINHILTHAHTDTYTVMQRLIDINARTHWHTHVHMNIDTSNINACIHLCTSSYIYFCWASRQSGVLTVVFLHAIYIHAITNILIRCEFAVSTCNCAHIATALLLWDCTCEIKYNMVTIMLSIISRLITIMHLLYVQEHILQHLHILKFFY